MIITKIQEGANIKTPTNGQIVKEGATIKAPIQSAPKPTIQSNKPK